MSSMDTDNLKATIVQPSPQKLTLTELEVLREQMQSHMDKALTYGQRSAVQIGDLTVLADTLSNGLLPQLGIHMGYIAGGPSPVDPLLEEVGEKIELFGETVTEWGDTLGMIAKEYNGMINEILKFQKKIEKHIKAD